MIVCLLLITTNCIKFTEITHFHNSKFCIIVYCSNIETLKSHILLITRIRFKKIIWKSYRYLFNQITTLIDYTVTTPHNTYFMQWKSFIVYSRNYQLGKFSKASKSSQLFYLLVLLFCYGITRIIANKSEQ